MNQGFAAFQEDVLARWLVGSVPFGEQYGRLHFGPSAGKFVTRVPARGRWEHINQRADLKLMDGALVQIDNLPGGRPAMFAADGTTLNPTHPVVLINSPGLTGIATASEQLPPTLQVLLPLGILNKDGRRLRGKISGSRAGSTDTCRVRVHFGTAGTNADATVFDTAAFAASNPTWGFSFELIRINSTTLRLAGSGNNALPYGGPSTSTVIADVTVANMDTSAIYVSPTVTMGGATDVPTIREWFLDFAA
jgi:hypothetical protein